MGIVTVRSRALLSTGAKIGIGVAAIALLLVPTAVLFYQNQQLRSEVAQYAGRDAIAEKALTESLRRAQTEIAKNTRELELFAERIGLDIGAVKEDLKSLDAQLLAVAATEARTVKVVHNHYPSDSSTPSEIEVPQCHEDGRPIDIHGYTNRVETRELVDSNGMRVADVSFSAAQERPWSSSVYGIRYHILNTVATGPAGQVLMTTELTAENPEAQPGEVFRIDGVESRVLQAPPAPPEFRWIDPSLYLMGQVSVIVWEDPAFSASLSLGVSLMSYGRDWRFLGISAGYDAFQNAFRASFFPFLYNVGGPIPFLSDLWLGLDVAISHESDVGVGLVIGTRL